MRKYLNLSLLVFATFLFIQAQTSNCSIISCDFDEDFCNFISNGLFVRYSGQSPSFSSGPSGDHTNGEEGYYALCYGSRLLNETDKCTLSQDVVIEQESIFSFWYFMFGSQIGTLELLADGDSIWSKTGRQLNEWLLAEVFLPVGNYTLQFSANRSITGRLSSNIAIDDVMIEGQMLTTKLVTRTRTIPVGVYFPRNCNFDNLNDFCGWDTDYDNNKWIQTNGSLNLVLGLKGPESDWSSITLPNIIVPFFGPPVNASTFCSIPYCAPNNKIEYYCQFLFFRRYGVCGISNCPTISDDLTSGRCASGNYLMIPNEKYNTSSTSFRSRLISQVYTLMESRAASLRADEDGVNASTSLCMSFAYNINGNTNAGFTLSLENYLNPNEMNLLMKKQGPLDVDRWYYESIQIIGLNYQQFRFIFEPFNGDSYEYSSVSIDQISFNEGDCVQISTTFGPTIIMTTTTVADLSTSSTTTPDGLTSTTTSTISESSPTLSTTFNIEDSTSTSETFDSTTSDKIRTTEAIESSTSTSTSTVSTYEVSTTLPEIYSTTTTTSQAEVAFTSSIVSNSSTSTNAITSTTTSSSSSDPNDYFQSTTQSATTTYSSPNQNQSTFYSHLSSSTNSFNYTSSLTSTKTSLTTSISESSTLSTTIKIEDSSTATSSSTSTRTTVDLSDFFTISTTTADDSTDTAIPTISESPTLSTTLNIEDSTSTSETFESSTSTHMRTTQVIETSTLTSNSSNVSNATTTIDLAFFNTTTSTSDGSIINFTFEIESTFLVTTDQSTSSSSSSTQASQSNKISSTTIILIATIIPISFLTVLSLIGLYFLQKSKKFQFESLRRKFKNKNKIEPDISLNSTQQSSKLT